MIPKYCPNCGSLLDPGNNRYIRDELLFQIFSEEDLIQMHNERIKGPCSYCGGDHWKPDCKKYYDDTEQAHANLRTEEANALRNS